MSQLVILENSPKGTLIGEIVATVANAEETPVYSITSQSPAGAIALDGNKMVIADASAFVYDTNKELTGEIQATVGGVTTTATFTVLVDKLIEIPGDSFKAGLLDTKDLDVNGDTISIDANGDGEISLLEAQAYTGEIDILIVKDFTGIEYFTNIAGLILSFNKIIAIDVSQNTALTKLDLSTNQLTIIDVSQNTALTKLSLFDNQLTALDVSKNTALIELGLNNNQLTAIDVSNNTALTNLSLDNNQLTAIDVSQNTALTELNLSNNQLTAIDVSKNTALTVLNLQNNALTKVNLANGNNDKLTELNLSNNSNSVCVQVDQLPVPAASQAFNYDPQKVKFQTEACK